MRLADLLGRGIPATGNSNSSSPKMGMEHEEANVSRAQCLGQVWRGWKGPWRSLLGLWLYCRRREEVGGFQAEVLPSNLMLKGSLLGFCREERLQESQEASRDPS